MKHNGLSIHLVLLYLSFTQPHNRPIEVSAILGLNGTLLDLNSTLLKTMGPSTQPLAAIHASSDT